MQWYMVLLYVFTALVGPTATVFVGLFLHYHIKRSLKARLFKKYFDSKPEVDTDLRKFQVKTKILPEINSCARALTDNYQSETRILNQMKSGAGEYHQQKEALATIRGNIKFYEQEFYKGIRIANFFGYEVPESYKDYVN